MSHSEAWGMIATDCLWILLSLLPLASAGALGICIGEGPDTTNLPCARNDALAPLVFFIIAISSQSFWVGSYFGWFNGK